LQFEYRVNAARASTYCEARRIDNAFHTWKKYSIARHSSNQRVQRGMQHTINLQIKQAVTCWYITMIVHRAWIEKVKYATQHYDLVVMTKAWHAMEANVIWYQHTSDVCTQRGQRQQKNFVAALFTIWRRYINSFKVSQYLHREYEFRQTTQAWKNWLIGHANYQLRKHQEELRSAARNEMYRRRCFRVWKKYAFIQVELAREYENMAQLRHQELLINVLAHWKILIR
jgi:hypothetical protein